jgi:hypothetical protein
MGRTNRTPAEVLDAAVFGVLQAGHLAGFGADADHLKTLDDVDRCAEAGFVSFTLDAIEKVIDAAPRMNDADLEQAYQKILAEVPAARDWEKKYSGKTFTPSAWKAAPSARRSSSTAAPSPTGSRWRSASARRRRAARSRSRSPSTRRAP